MVLSLAAKGSLNWMAALAYIGCGGCMLVMRERREVLVGRGHLAGLSCAAAVLCSGVAVAWMEVSWSVQCSGVRLASVVGKVEGGKVR